MNMAFLDQALEEFSAAVDDVRLNADFLEVASKLRPRLGSQCIAWDTLAEPEKLLVQTFIRTGCDAGTSLQGLVVRLVASFEAFLRRMVRDGVRAISASCVQYESLRADLRKRNVQYVGRALSTVFEPIGYLELNFEQLCSEIGTCVPASGGVTLSADAFAMSVRGTAFDRLDASFKIFGADLNLDAIAKDTGVMKALPITGTRETAKTLRKKLDEVQSRRNSYAHTGIGGIVVNADDIKALATLLLALATASKKLLEREIRTRHLGGTA